MWKQLDWSMISFVTMSAFQDYWLTVQLPRVYYWDVRKEALQSSKLGNDNKDSAA